MVDFVNTEPHLRTRNLKQSCIYFEIRWEAITFQQREAKFREPKKQNRREAYRISRDQVTLWSTQYTLVLINPIKTLNLWRSDQELGQKGVGSGANCWNLTWVWREIDKESFKRILGRLLKKKEGFLFSLKNRNWRETNGSESWFSLESRKERKKREACSLIQEKRDGKGNVGHCFLSPLIFSL